MKDLTVFHTTYRELLQQGRTWAESFCEATEAQDLFDKYIAEQIEASKLQPVDAKTAMQDFTEAISLNPDTAGKCNGNCGMIYCDVNGCIESKKNLVEDVPFLTKVGEDDLLCFYQSLDNCPKSAKYLARKPEAFVPCWEWKGIQSPVQEFFIMEGPDGFFFRYRKGGGNLSAYYPTLEAAQLEAERYYRLYIEPNLK